LPVDGAPAGTVDSPWTSCVIVGVGVIVLVGLGDGVVVGVLVWAKVTPAAKPSTVTAAPSVERIRFDIFDIKFTSPPSLRIREV